MCLPVSLGKFAPNEWPFVANKIANEAKQNERKREFII